MSGSSCLESIDKLIQMPRNHEEIVFLDCVFLIAQIGKPDNLSIDMIIQVSRLPYGL
jgi:hypothetical protein